MLHPAADDNSEDPTSQIPWPSRRPRNMGVDGDGADSNTVTPEQEATPGKDGAQIVWTVELGYGTPFLLSLGLSEQT
ncbi:hypothetical protein MPER_04892 [Moniliophthora perniciosa FA553]|nr:hypothetical protein MPER_04892 [Moniliophthora perniciosa FA553]